MKKLVSLVMVVTMMLSVMAISFVDAGAQEYNFEDNRISFMLKQSGKYEVTLENLSQFGVIEIEQVDSLWYYLILDKHDHQNVLDVIDRMEHTEESYLYSVHVVNIPVEDPYKDSQIKQAFINQYGTPQFYDEIMYQYFDEEKTVLDWVLINVAVETMVEPIENPQPHYYTVGDIVYGSIYYHGPFDVPYCVYDAKNNEFIGISEVDFDEYKGLREVFCTPKYGKLIGDVDEDGRVSIVDATYIQCMLAKKTELAVMKLIVDFNRDGEISVLDATCIQRKLAKI